MSIRIIDVREVTKPIASPIRNAYIDFSRMTTSPSMKTAQGLKPCSKDLAAQVAGS